MAIAAVPLAELVRDLRRQKALLSPEELAHRVPQALPTGLSALDELLGGGLPEGRMLELTGGAAGAVSLSVLASFTASGRLAALVDRGDGFDPRSAAAAGVDLERLLWCRPASHKEAVKAADVLLASAAFPLVILDLRVERVDGTRRREPDVPAAAWLRLSRDAEAARARFLVVEGSGASAFAAASLRLSPPRACFDGQGPGRTFEGFEAEVRLERNRLGRPAATVRLSFAAPPWFPEPRHGSASGSTTFTAPVTAKVRARREAAACEAAGREVVTREAVTREAATREAATREAATREAAVHGVSGGAWPDREEATVRAGALATEPSSGAETSGREVLRLSMLRAGPGRRGRGRGRRR